MSADGGITPIETIYQHYRFRSRLEARWAVYFDAIGLEWEYEPEGFDLGDGLLYLPDFWLPQVSMWAEVKAKPLTAREWEKALRLVVGSVCGLVCLVGVPDSKPYDAIFPDPYEPYPPDLPIEEKVKQHLTDVTLSMYHGYPRDEGRFYVASCMERFDPVEDGGWLGDVFTAVAAARAARFEHGEVG